MGVGKLSQELKSLELAGEGSWRKEGITACGNVTEPMCICYPKVHFVSFGISWRRNTVLWPPLVLFKKQDTYHQFVYCNINGKRVINDGIFTGAGHNVGPLAYLGWTFPRRWPNGEIKWGWVTYYDHMAGGINIHQIFFGIPFGCCLVLTKIARSPFWLTICGSQALQIVVGEATNGCKLKGEITISADSIPNWPNYGPSYRFVMIGDVSSDSP